MSKPTDLVKRRPAETAAPTVLGALTALLVAFGLDAARAAAIAGAVAVITPTVITWWRTRES